MSRTVDTWIKRMPMKSDDEVERLSVFGRALSRSSTHLHFATQNGVMSIPVSDIEEVEERFPDDPNRVRLTLKSSRSMTRIRRPAVARAPRFADEPIVIIGPGVNTTVCTTTYTGSGDETTCDDDGCVDSDDDLGQ